MTFTDQLNRNIEFNFPPRKIISLVPSQSELLWDLGLQSELAGITKFCIHPKEMFNSVKRIGGTKTIHINEIKKINPCLIIANKEENRQEQIEELCALFPVYISNIYNMRDALQMIEHLGIITNRQERADRIISSIHEKYTSFKNQVSRNKTEQKKVVYLIWKDPYMAAGSDTFITNMLHDCGWINVFAQHPGRYPQINIEELKAQNPNLIFLSSEPYPFKEKHIAELQAQLPQTKILLVDGEMFSWYGSRLLYAFDYFKSLLRKINSD